MHFMQRNHRLLHPLTLMRPSVLIALVASLSATSVHAADSCSTASTTSCNAGGYLVELVGKAGTTVEGLHFTTPCASDVTALTQTGNWQTTGQTVPIYADSVTTASSIERFKILLPDAGNVSHFYTALAGEKSLVTEVLVRATPQAACTEGATSARLMLPSALDATTGLTTSASFCTIGTTPVWRLLKQVPGATAPFTAAKKPQHRFLVDYSAVLTQLAEAGGYWVSESLRGCAPDSYARYSASVSAFTNTTTATQTALTTISSSTSFTARVQVTPPTAGWADAASTPSKAVISIYLPTGLLYGGNSGTYAGVTCPSTAVSGGQIITCTLARPTTATTLDLSLTSSSAYLPTLTNANSRSIKVAVNSADSANAALGIPFAPQACTDNATPQISCATVVLPLPTASATSTRFKAEVWADNWFSAYVGEVFAAEDSVPITTEKSFNSETFYFDGVYPFDMNFVVKDYKQNDTGLEYIGTANQQIGDGGFIMQITDTATGKIAAVSNAAMKCLVIHKAPLNPTCEKDANPTATCTFRSDAEPAGWKRAGYDVSSWENATVYSAAEVGAKDGYLNINWDSSAKLVWTSSLKLDNTLLCKATVTASTVTPTATVPTAPTAVTATAGNASAIVAFAAPTSNGGSAITAYTASCTAAAAVTRTVTATSSPITVAALANGTSYACTVTATNLVGNSAASTAANVTPTAGSSTGGTFTLTSTVGVSGGALPATYTCDGPGSTPALAWTGAPAGTTEFAVLMTTLPVDGTTKYNWVLYGIPAGKSGLITDSYGVGTLGVGSDGPIMAYQPPCSQGVGSKVYSFTVYALSASPTLPSAASGVSGSVLASAMSSITLGTASISLTATRAATATGLTTGCGYIASSLRASTTGSASVGCDANYGYISSNGLASHAMMNGITATNLQVPLAQNFFGGKGWKIPLNPAIAATTTTAVDGPVGVAINGVPIFNPCKQGGCQNGDTKVLGELDICNGHAGRADDYHYHAAPTCMMAGQSASYWNTHPVGWALDGFAIYGYNNADGTVATRDDVCGGNTTAVSNGPGGYSYHVTDASPYVLSCFRGTPSPDLLGQGAKFSPVRQPPVTPFAVTGMTLTTEMSDGYQVLQFTSARTFVTTETGSDNYSNAAGTYQIRYKPVTGSALTALLNLSQNSGKSSCWNFQFSSGSGATTQPTISYCR
jgi:phosphatidylethanolamine-binding protein (PEBP) family uncharacterized protein